MNSHNQDRNEGGYLRICVSWTANPSNRLHADGVKVVTLMTTNSNIQGRIDGLLSELERNISHHQHRAKLDHHAAIWLMLIALLASAGAGLGGLFLDANAKVVGAIALLPGIMALIASTMKYQGKSHWHYRKRDSLSELKLRLLYELPEFPTADNVAAVARSLRSLTKERW